MQGGKTAKLKLDPAEEAQASLVSKLYVGEEVRWKGLPNSSFFMIDLTYKGLIWWSIFVFIVPIQGGSPELTALLVLLLTWLEFKKTWNSRAYVITNLRAISADKLRNGDWRFTDYPLASLVSSRQTALLKSLVMKFRIINRNKTLKFPYLSDGKAALAALSVPTDEPVIEARSHDITGGVLRESESESPQSMSAPKAAPDINT
jgi:hypothetical protein